MMFWGREVQFDPSEDGLSGGALSTIGLSRSFMSIEELVPLLCDPLTKEALSLDGSTLRSPLRDFSIEGGSPMLFPCDLEEVERVLQSPGTLSELPKLAPLQQYCAYGMLKACGNSNNLGAEDAWYGRHLWRSRRMLEPVRGTFLDIGCDDALISRGMLHESIRYVGLDPSRGMSPVVRVGGLGEFLPFKDGSFDAAGFVTSLDHVFDYHLAVQEASRVLKRGGVLCVGTLLWTHEAQLHPDTVHFHHFRSYEIEGALAEHFDLIDFKAYRWKHADHRFGVYLRAAKK